MTSQITGGLVSVEDGKKAAEEYAPARKVRVDLTFTVGEGEDYQAVFDAASQAADLRVGALVHGKAFSVVPATEARTVATPATPIASPLTVAEAGTATLASDPSAVVDETAAEPEKPKRVRRTQAQIAADKAAAEAAGVPAGADPSAIVDEDPTAGAGDPSAIVDEDPSAIVDAEFTIEPDEPDEPDEAAEDDPVTDADLNDAVMKKNAALGNPTLIRELIKTYNPDPTKVFQLRDIPAADRQRFIKELAALKPAAA